MRTRGCSQTTSVSRLLQRVKAPPLFAQIEEFTTMTTKAADGDQTSWAPLVQRLSLSPERRIWKERPAGATPEAGGRRQAGQSHAETTPATLGVFAAQQAPEPDQNRTGLDPYNSSARKATWLLPAKARTSGPARRSRRQQRCCSPGPRRTAGVQQGGDPLSRRPLPAEALVHEREAADPFGG